MTLFMNGPANDQRLALRRSPRFLRVVTAAGKWDALDQLDDTPASGEKIYAYEIIEGPFVVHLRRRGGGGVYSAATYRYIEDQPSDEIMRAAGDWRQWCQTRAAQKPQS